jgi:hypothetical protein
VLFLCTIVKIMLDYAVNMHSNKIDMCHKVAVYILPYYATLRIQNE